MFRQFNVFSINTVKGYHNGSQEFWMGSSLFKKIVQFIFQEIRSYDYRSAIHKVVPNVKILDDEPFLVEKVDGKPVLRQPPASHRPNKVPEHLKADWQLVSEGIKAISIDEEEESSCMSLLSIINKSVSTSVLIVDTISCVFI